MSSTHNNYSHTRNIMNGYLMNESFSLGKRHTTITTTIDTGTAAVPSLSTGGGCAYLNCMEPDYAALTTFSIKNEQEDYVDNNNVFTTTATDAPLLDNYSYYQSFSPSLSYSTQSPLDLGYSDNNNNNNNNGMLDYFMTSPSSAASLSASPPPPPSSTASASASLSPETTNIELYYYNDNSTIDNNYFYDYQNAALKYPLIKTEPLPCYNTTDDYLLATISSNTNNTKNNGNNNGINIGIIKKQQQQPGSPESTCTVLSSSSSSGITVHKKIYPCNYCNRSFARKYDVARHKRIHTGSKPYVCPCCSRGFSRSDARVRHFRTEIACRDGADKLGRHRTHQKFISSLSNL